MDLLTKTLVIGMILGIAIPLIGFFLVLRKQAFITEAIAHIAINGIIIASILGLNPILFTSALGSLTSILLEKNREKNYLQPDSLLSIILVGGLALSILLLSLFSDLRISLVGLLFGNILFTNVRDIYIIAIVAIITLLFVRTNYKRLFNATFDPKYSTFDISHRYLQIAFSIIVGIVIGSSIQSFGALLIGGILVIPANTALLLQRGFKQSLLLTISLAQCSIILGILLAFALNIPTGASIILVSIAIYLLIFILRKLSNKS